MLLDNVPGLSEPEVTSIVQKAMRAPITSIFSHFDYKPLGAASIGQVHRATLKNGQQVGKSPC